MNWRETHPTKLATRENPKFETYNSKLKTVHHPIVAKKGIALLAELVD
jgi:hypothetical protein